MGPMQQMFPNGWGRGSWRAEGTARRRFRFYTVRFETPAPSPTKSACRCRPSRGAGRGTVRRADALHPTETAAAHGRRPPLVYRAQHPSVLAASVMGTPVVDDPTAVTNNDAMDLGIKVLQRFVKQSRCPRRRA